MARSKKNILKDLENILDDEKSAPPPAKHATGAYVATPKPEYVEAPRVHDQHKDLRHLLQLFNYHISEDGNTYSKHFASKKYDNVITFLDDGKIQIDCSIAPRKVLDISDAFNWIY